MALQKINFEAEASLADVVMGLDQFDVVRHGTKIKWRDMNRNENPNFVDEIKPVSKDLNFIPYNWAPMSFIGRRSANLNVNKMTDLLQESLKSKIALQDPRTSSPGLQFLVWVFENNSTEKAIAFLKAMQRQVHSYSPSWSTAYGLFKNNQADLVFSYVTSPIYHQVEEKDNNYFGYETQEPLAAQVEFAGIPASCKNCEGAELFVFFLHSPQAQKILMTKNYMFPVIRKVKEATPFDALKVYRTLPIKFHEASQIEKWLNTWVEVRKNEAQ